MCRVRADDQQEVGRENMSRLGAEDRHDIMIFICMIEYQETKNCLVVYPGIVLIGDQTPHVTDYRARSNSCSHYSLSKNGVCSMSPIVRCSLSATKLILGFLTVEGWSLTP